MSTGLAVALACGGVILWLGGAVWSRSLVTLILVALGTWLGIRLPAWCGWQIDRMGPAIGGALVLGISGYTLHRWWIGLAVGWTSAAILIGLAAPVWMVMHRPPESTLASASHLNAPREQVSVLAESTLSAVSPTLLAHPRQAARWCDLAGQLLGVPVVQFMAGAGVVGFVVGLMIAVRWPRLSAALVWSSAGLCLAGTMGLALATREHGDLPLDWICNRPWVALAPMAALALGTGIQFFLAARIGSVAIPAKTVDAED